MNTSQIRFVGLSLVGTAALSIVFVSGFSQTTDLGNETLDEFGSLGQPREFFIQTFLPDPDIHYTMIMPEVAEQTVVDIQPPR